ncbi:MAG: hypothetical protein ABIM99_03270 [Candidatus Dojkabacteria bacterium]
MEKIKSYIKLHPRRTILFSIGLVLVILCLIALLMIIANQNNQKSLTNITNINPQPTSYIVSYITGDYPPTTDNKPAPVPNPIIPIPQPYTRPYLSVPVGVVACNINEKVYISGYYSFCYPDTYVVDHGPEGSIYVSIKNPNDTTEAPYIVELIDGNLALNFHTFPEGYNSGYTTSIDYVGSAFHELDKQSASSIEFAQAPNYKGTVAYTYLLKSPVLNTFATTQTWNFPDRERKTFILFHGTVNLMFVYEQNAVTQRMFDSIAFSH